MKGVYGLESAFWRASKLVGDIDDGAIGRDRERNGTKQYVDLD